MKEHNPLEYKKMVKSYQEKMIQQVGLKTSIKKPMVIINQSFGQT